jgi:hypothetical protein
VPNPTLDRDGDEICPECKCPPSCCICGDFMDDDGEWRFDPDAEWSEEDA